MRVWSRLLLMSMVLGLLPSALSIPARTAGRPAHAAPAYLAWLRADPHAPRVLFLLGFWDCPGERGIDNVFGSGGHCPPWLLRSADGGVHWTDLRPTLSQLAAIVPDPATFEDPNQGFVFYPAFFSPDGRSAYLSVEDGASPFSQKYTVLWSSDRGVHWQAADPDLTLDCGESNVGLTQAVLSPAPGARLYAILKGSYSTHCGDEYSTDGGQSWQVGGSWLGRSWAAVVSRLRHVVYDYGSFVPDPRRPATLYENLVTPIGQGLGYQDVARSEDAGMHWSLVISPTLTPPLQTFEVGLDVHEDHLLVGYPGGPGVPADRRYLSADAGRSWRAATCPGDLHGTCPAGTVDNVFGAGASYAFVGDGIYRFHGGGPAEARLALSARLPFRVADLRDVSAGVRAGDPVYALVKGVRGVLHGLLYRSIDGGRSWQELLTGPFPIHKLRPAGD